MTNKKRYTVKIYNDFDVKLDEQEIMAENVTIYEGTYLFLNFNNESGLFDTVAIVDRGDNRVIDVFAKE